MRKQIKKRPIFEINEETKEDIKVGEEQYLIVIPDMGKCFMNKKTGHKFIHTITGKGLSIPVNTEEEFYKLYQEVSL